ncbi:MAG: GNAT family N-acetyltransferase [Cellulosilyticaceae bacterium]
MKVKKILDLEDFRQMYELEAMYYTQEHITPAEESYRWYQKYPYTVCALEDEGCIVAFINLLPIGEALFEEIKSGRFNDKNLEVEQILDIDQPIQEKLYMFLCCVVIHETYRGQNLLQMLIREGRKPYEAIASHVLGIITDNVTPEGERLSQKLGMQYVTKTWFDSVIYVGDYGVCIERV